MGFLDRIGAIGAGLGGALEAPVNLVGDLIKAPFVDDGQSGFIHTLWNRTTDRGAQMLDYLFSPNDSLVGSSIGALPGVVRNPVGDVVHPILNGDQWLYTNAISHPLATLLTVGSLTESNMWKQQEGDTGVWNVLFDPSSWSKAWNLTQHQSPGQALAINLNFAFGPNYGIGQHKDILDQGEINKFEGSDFYHVASGVTDAVTREFDPIGMALGGIPGVENLPGVAEKGFLSEGLLGGVRNLVNQPMAPEVEAAKQAAIAENFGRGMTAEQRAAGVQAVAQAGEQAKAGMIQNYLQSSRWDRLNNQVAAIREAAPDLNTATAQIADLFPKNDQRFTIGANLAAATNDTERAITMRVLMGENNAAYLLQDNAALREALRSQFEEQAMIHSTAYDQALHESEVYRPDVSTGDAVQQTLENIGQEQYDSTDAIQQRLREGFGAISGRPMAPTGFNPLIPLKSSEFYQQSAWTKPIRMFENKVPSGYINLDDPSAVTNMDGMLRDAGFLQSERQPWIGRFTNAMPAERAGVVLDAEQAALGRLADRFGVSPEEMDAFRSVANAQRAQAMDILRGAARDAEGNAKVTLPGLDQTDTYTARLSDTGNDLIVPDMKAVAAKFGLMQKLGVNTVLSPVNEVLNDTMKLWRPGTLLRPAWPVRVIADHSLAILGKMNGLADGSDALRQRIADYATFRGALQNFYTQASKEFGLGWGTVGGASLGGIIGGPVGAAIGGGVGAGIQLLGRQLEENPYLQLGINGFTAQGAFGNELDKQEINKALVSSRRDLDVGVGRLAPGRVNPLPTDPAEMTTILPGTPGYVARWESLVNDQLAKDPLARMILAHDHLPYGADARYTAGDIRNWVDENTIPKEGEDLAAKGVIPYVREADSLNREYNVPLHDSMEHSIGVDYSIGHINPKDIVSMQGRVDPSPLHDYINTPEIPEPVTVVKTGDKYYLWDGNHRVSAALAKDDATIAAEIHDFEPVKGMTEAQAEAIAKSAADAHVYPEPLKPRTGVDVAKTWLTSTREGKAYAAANPLRAANIDNWTNSISDLAHDLTLRDADLANKLASGQTVTRADLEAAAQRNVGEGVAVKNSDFPTLHFEQARQTMGRASRVVRFTQGIIEKLYRGLGTLPLDTMINQRFDALVYASQMEKRLAGVLPEMTTDLPDLAGADGLVDKMYPTNFGSTEYHPLTGEPGPTAENRIPYTRTDASFSGDLIHDVNTRMKPEDFVEKQVPISSIVSEQPDVFPQIIKDYMDLIPEHGPATGFDMGNGMHYLFDGAHRINAAMLRGDANVAMEVADMSKYYRPDELAAMRAEVNGLLEHPAAPEALPRQTVKFSDDTMRAIEDSSRKVALQQMRKTMYDYADRSEFADMMRHVMPFFPAWQQTIQRWAGIALENPQFIRRAAQVLAAPGKMGATWKDPDTGESYVRFRLPEFARALIGHGVLQGALDDQGYMKFQTKGLTPALGAPGFGPWVDVALKPFIDQRPELADSFKMVYPYGVPQNALQAFIPPNIQNTITTQTDAGNSYRSAYNRILITRLVKMQTGELPMLDLNNEQNRAQFLGQVAQEAHQFSAFRTVMGMVSPVSGLQYDSPYQPMIDTYRQLEKTDPLHAQDRFLNEFGDEFFALTQAFTKVNNGVPATLQGQAAEAKYQDMIQRFPELGSLIIGNEGGGSAVQFSNAAYQKQLSTPLRPGSSTMERTQMSPEEIIQQEDQRLGWIKFTRAMDLIDAEMSQRGISNINDKRAADLRLIKDLVTTKIATEHPQWYQDYQNRDETKWTNRIAMMRQIVQDPRLSQRPDIEALRGYLAARDAIVAMLATRKTSGIDGAANADIKWLWDTVINSKKAGPGGLAFSDLYNRWLVNDPMTQPGVNTLGLPQEKVA